MPKIRVLVSPEAVTEKVVKYALGEFKLQGIKIGEKFIPIRSAKGTTLPTSGELICNFYARKYKNKMGEFEELTLYCENAVGISTDDLPTDDLDL